MKNDILKLVYETSTQDTDGFPTVTRAESEFWCDIQSVRCSEYYAAASSNIKVNLVAVMNLVDYEEFRSDNGNPSKVVIDGDDYIIIRTYRKKKEGDIELTLCEVE